jgi:alpha-beta hydrolase superfamily lysophospholipase
VPTIHGAHIPRAQPPHNQYPAASEAVVHRVSVQELASLLTQAGFEMKTIETRPNVRHQLTAEAAAIIKGVTAE